MIIMKILVLDTETSGLNPEKHGILSVSAKVFGGKEEFHELCKISKGREVEKEAIQVNGLDPYDINKMDEYSLMLLFGVWMDTYGPFEYVAGANIGFDESFLRCTTSRYGLKWGRIMKLELQTLSLLVSYRNLAPFVQVPTLDNMLKSVGLSRGGNKHDSLEDIRLTEQLLDIYLRKLNIMTEFLKP